MEMAHTKGATLKKKYSLRHFCVFLMFFSGKRSCFDLRCRYNLYTDIDGVNDNPVTVCDHEIMCNVSVPLATKTVFVAAA